MILDAGTDASLAVVVADGGGVDVHFSIAGEPDRTIAVPPRSTVVLARSVPDSARTITGVQIVAIDDLPAAVTVLAGPGPVVVVSDLVASLDDLTYDGETWA